MSQDQLDRIESKQDAILNIVTTHNILLNGTENNPEIGLVSQNTENEGRIKSLESSRIKFMALVSGVGLSGGTMGAWIAKMFKIGENLTP